MEITVPSVGESVFEALVALWRKEDGAPVRRDEVLCELETDKITFELQAEADGILHIAVPAGQTVKIGAVIGSIEPGGGTAAMEPTGATAGGTPPSAATQPSFVMPAARKLAAEQGVDPTTLPGTGKGGRVTVADVQHALSGQTPPAAAPIAPQPVPPLTGHPPAEPPESRSRRVPMTPIRRRIAERLLQARQQTAMLTTFNEVEMSRVLALRSQYQEVFRQRHQVSLGLMSFFVKASVEALREYPEVNASIDGDDIVYHDFYDLGIAIGAEKGLVVPVVRDADRLRFPEIEQQIADYGRKVKENRLTIADLEGGTFTISNGGVYGSLLSTPIINPPQSAVLGMHAIQNRPVERDGQIVLRPMMYLALSYDHRLIDGRTAVQFLKRICTLVAEPDELFLEV